MKGLLLKDAYQLWSYTRWIILASVAMMLMGTFFMKEGSNFFMLYGGLLLGILPMTLLAYDQNGRFSAYSAALPVTKEQIVGGKYLIGLCGMVLAELLSMATLAAAQLLWGTVTVQITVATLLQVAMLTLLGNIIWPTAWATRKPGMRTTCASVCLQAIWAISSLRGTALWKASCLRRVRCWCWSSCWRRRWRCMPSRGGCPLHGTERQSSKMKKSQIAGILFGVAMGVLFSVSMGTVGFALGAGFVGLGMVMFEGLDDPQDKK